VGIENSGWYNGTLVQLEELTLGKSYDGCQSVLSAVVISSHIGDVHPRRLVIYSKVCTAACGVLGGEFRSDESATVAGG
jgi:hypothetical protein